MSKFNAFRPTINAMEDRSMMSVTLAALPAEPLAYEVKLEDCLISSYQSRGHEGASVGSSGMSAGKVSYSDLSVMISLENARIDDLIISGDQPQPARHKETIEIQSWSFGASNPTSTGYRYELEDVIISGVQVDDDATGYAGSHALYQDITIPTGSTASAPSISEIIVTKDQDTASIKNF